MHSTINASEEFKKHPEVRKLNILSDDNICQIVETYKNFDDSDGFARVVLLDEIKENDYNLNVPLYAFPQEEIEEIDIAAEWNELKELEEELEEINKKIEGYLKEVG
ncbi:MAG: N-6 DNA methylase [Methanobacteriaceae archaeon]